MSLFFGETEITNIDNLVPQSGLDITDIWFGATNIYTVWETYEGTLPATVNANGDDMCQYRLYGNAGGVGDRTVNEFDKLTVEQYLYTSISSPNKWYSSNAGNVLRFPCDSNTTYTIKIFNSVSGVTLFRLAMTDSENIPDDENYVPTTRIVNETSLQPVTTFQTGANTKYILLQVNNTVATIDGIISSLTLTEGTTPPENYAPYGYEVDISTSDGTNATVTPIYIGDTALQKDEYIDYEAQKVYRRTENELNNRLITNRYPGTSMGNIQLSVKPNMPYTLKTNCPRYNNGALIVLDNKIGGSTTLNNGAWDGHTRTITSTSEGVLYIGYRGNNSGYDLTSYLYMLTEGTTPPETYVPYLTPTDPPVPLPALPTCNGETIVDYAGESQATPEKVLLKYRKEGF